MMRTRIFSARSGPSSPHHPDAQELIDLHQHRLDGARAGQVRAHVLQCAACQSVFRQVADFLEPAREAEPVLDEADLQYRLSSLYSRMTTLPRKTRTWRTTAPAALLACSLLIFAIISSAWLYRGQHRAPVVRIAQLRSPGTQHQPPYPPRGQFQLNVLVMEVFSARVRGTGPLTRSVLRVPADLPALILILNSDSEDPSASYRVGITNEAGQEVWSGAGLRRDREMDRYTIAIPPKALPPGDYTISIYTEGVQPYRLVDRYLIRIAKDS
jgi:hypothetical protein